MSRLTQKNIGVIGLGIIGRSVAGNLRRRGFPVFVWNRSPRSVPNFVGSLGELAEVCNYIQIFVSDDGALLQTVEQLSGDLAPRHLVLAHSTVAPDSMRAAAEIAECKSPGAWDSSGRSKSQRCFARKDFTCQYDRRQIGRW